MRDVIGCDNVSTNSLYVVVAEIVSLVMPDVLGQKRMEYQSATWTGIQAGKVQSGEGLTTLE